jgi:type 1 fimbria pilin
MKQHFLRNTVLNAGLLLWSISGIAGQSSNTVNFTATFIAGTCDITVTPASINWGAVSSSEIRQAGEAGTQPMDLSVNYANCTGLGVQPKLIINGTVLTAGIPLFTRNNNSGAESASGYGVRLVKSTALQTALGNGDSVMVGTAGQQLDMLNGTSTEFKTSLSCGNNCADPSLRGGTLGATVTFQFLYE